MPAVEGLPDFRLRRATGNGVRSFEIVEARYPSLPDRFQELRHEDPDEHFRAGLCEAAKQIRKKAEKGYSPRRHLIVYCNFWRREVLVEEARAMADPYRDKLLSIWLLWVESSDRKLDAEPITTSRR
jgi:hypothetical protein